MGSGYVPLDGEEPSEQAEWRAHVDQRLDDGAATMKELRRDLAENTATTNKVQTDTSELVELLKSFKGAFKVLDMLGKLAKPLCYIAIFFGAVVGAWAAVKGLAK